MMEARRGGHRRCSGPRDVLCRAVQVKPDEKNCHSDCIKNTVAQGEKGRNKGAHNAKTGQGLNLEETEEKFSRALC